MWTVAVSVLSVALPAVLLARAIQGRFVSRLPYFFAYIAFILCSTIIELVLLTSFPKHYATVYWFDYLLAQVVEFAVLLEVSNILFDPYPALRRLGGLLCGGVITCFTAIYIFPALLYRGPTNTLLLDLVKRTALTKALIVLVLLFAARSYKLKLDRICSGILLGFSLYLGVSVANFQLASTYGRALYAPILWYVGPLGWILGATIWTATLWNYAPAAAQARPPRKGNHETAVPVAAQIARFNNALLRLLQR
jgi:hypothetical protein